MTTLQLLYRIVIVAMVCSIITPAVSKPLYYTPEAAATLDPEIREKINSVAGLLEDKPVGFAVSIEDRDFWDAMAQTPSGQRIVENAERLMKEPMPVLTDDLYLMYTKNGNRTVAQKVIFARERRLVAFCLAECIENTGRFLKPLEEVLDSCISYPSWTLPAHDENLDNFYEKSITVDLDSAQNAHTYALTLALLKNRLTAPLAEKTTAKINEKVLTPYVNDVLNVPDSAKNWWRTRTNNWNSVCHAGVVGAALTLLEDKRDRALFIERAMHYMDYYYKGFTPDGYCSEGLGYWNYGYSHYIKLCELIYGATGGKIDLFKNPKGLPAALYPFRIEILNRHYPALADCSLNASPQAALMGYVNTRLGLKDERWVLTQEMISTRSMTNFLMFEQLDLNRPIVQPPFRSDHDQVRTWFSDAGVLICRPARNSDNTFATVFKGGHNDEHHNHNDLGSFIVLSGDQQILVDPGNVEYTSKTFSKDRYTIAKLASYGHSVPRIAGTQQIPGRDAEAKVIRTEFTESADTLVLDLASAYPVKGLEKLQRSFIYQRHGAGALEVTDEVAFTGPNTFETALITYGTCRTTGPNRLEVTSGGQTVDVQIDSGDNAIEISDEIVKSSEGDFRRIAIQFSKPVKNGKISMRILPKEG